MKLNLTGCLDQDGRIMKTLQTSCIASRIRRHEKKDLAISWKSEGTIRNGWNLSGQVDT